MYTEKDPILVESRYWLMEYHFHLVIIFYIHGYVTQMRYMYPPMWHLPAYIFVINH